MAGETVYFREAQRFRQLWMWILLAIIAAAAWYFFFEGVLFGGANGNVETALSVVVWVFSGIILPLFFNFLRLESEVRSDGVHVRFFPFHLKFKHFPWDEIAGYEPVEYRPILDYGGWGIRYGAKGKVYNVSGKEGVLFSFKDGRRDLLIGSRHPLEFAGSIESARRKR
jgi:hypothetical protein